MIRWNFDGRYLAKWYVSLAYSFHKSNSNLLSMILTQYSCVIHFTVHSSSRRRSKATSFARPPCIVDLYIDCQVAQYPEEADENGRSREYCPSKSNIPYLTER